MKGVEIPTDLARKQPRGCGRAIGLHGSPRRGDHHVRYSRPLDRLLHEAGRLGLLDEAARRFVDGGRAVLGRRDGDRNAEIAAGQDARVWMPCQRIVFSTFP